MCEKCQPKADLGCRLSNIELNKDQEPQFEIEVKDDVIDMLALWYDEARQTTMALRAHSAINYCPWCGRKLEDKNEH